MDSSHGLFFLFFFSSLLAVRHAAVGGKMETVVPCHHCGLLRDEIPVSPVAPVHSARIQSLLQSNEVPMDIEISQFRVFISRKSATVVSLDRDITELVCGWHPLWRKKRQPSTLSKNTSV
ncbi:hypothetical protein C8J56DRAFT_1029970 [Mycena floridula]|nr:hypothetical protein C8J56DRAFT_1029970 [Mycena floridula]